MHTLRVRTFMYVAMGIAVTMAGAWSMSAWRASAAVSADESTFVSVSPTRILDTREDIGLPGPFVSPLPQDLRVTGSIPTKVGTTVVVPDGATGVVLNVTVVGPTADGFLSIRPADAPGVPTTSNLNFSAGDIIPNSVTVQVPTSGADAGEIEITYDAFGNAGPTTEILVDLVGYTKNAGLASLQAQVNGLQTQIDQLNAAGAQVVFDGDAAGGALMGTYPNPNLAFNAVSSVNVIDGTLTANDLNTGSVGYTELDPVIVDTTEIIGGGPLAPGACSAPVIIAAPDTVPGDRALALSGELADGTANDGWAVRGLPTVNPDQARVEVCNFTGIAGAQPDIRVSLIILGA